MDPLLLDDVDDRREECSNESDVADGEIADSEESADATGLIRNHLSKSQRIELQKSEVRGMNVISVARRLVSNQYLRHIIRFMRI